MPGYFIKERILFRSIVLRSGMSKQRMPTSAEGIMPLHSMEEEQEEQMKGTALL